jgi:predicted amidohydrolase
MLVSPSNRGTAGRGAARRVVGRALITPELFLTGYNIGDGVFQAQKRDLLQMVQEIAEEGIARGRLAARAWGGSLLQLRGVPG